MKKPQSQSDRADDRDPFRNSDLIRGTGHYPPPTGILTNARPQPIQRDERHPSADGTKRPNR